VAAVSDRITLHLDPGLGWTRPEFVACCGACGLELARRTTQHAAERAARRRRCPGCGTRGARRLPGTTRPATDLALAMGRPAPEARRLRPPEHHPAHRLRRAGGR
jgi:hypothetical protein